MGVSIPLPGVPAGLVAYVRPRPDGSLPRDRRGRLKAKRVTLVRDPATSQTEATPGIPVPGVTEADLAWATRQERRRWPSIEKRFADASTATAHRLANAGVVQLHCTVTDTATVGELVGWSLCPAWDAHRASQEAAHAEHTESWTDRAAKAAERIDATDPGLAKTLRTSRGSSPLLPVLVHAAEDLAEGIGHDGPRAFSQTHFSDTKERADVAQVLTNAGASPDTLIALGLTRSPYLGLGGSVLFDTSDGTWNLAALAGPTEFRLSPDNPVAARVRSGQDTLVVIENKQAAEAICDIFPDLAVAYCAGQPSGAALTVIRGLGLSARRVLIATDADLGGVRIAQRLLTALQDQPLVQVLDVGTVEHVPGARFGKVSIEGLRQLSGHSGTASVFAKACLARGYRVEQEAAIRAAVAAVIDSSASPSGRRSTRKLRDERGPFSY
jgi:hypothetical protein